MGIQIAVVWLFFVYFFVSRITEFSAIKIVDIMSRSVTISFQLLNNSGHNFPITFCHGN